MITALLLIDIQNDYFPGGRMELAGADEAGKRVSELLALFRGKGLPVFHVQHEAVQPGATFFLPGSGGMDIHPCARPEPGEPVVRKHFPNSFRETGLEAALRGAGADRLLVAGMMTHMCLDAGVRAATDLGFASGVAADACATRDLEFGGRTATAAQVQTAFLGALAAAYAEVMDSAQAGGWVAKG